METCRYNELMNDELMFSYREDKNYVVKQELGKGAKRHNPF